MEEQVVLFDFEDKGVRILIRQEEVWFVAPDVCKVLGHSNSSQAVKDNCKPEGVSQAEMLDKMNRSQQVTIVNEANLYRLVMRSKVENALHFQDWVVEEILPSIRKTGKYELQKDSLTAMNLMRQQLDYLIEHEKQLREHKEKLENHETRLTEIEAQITTVNKDYLSLAGYYALKKQTWGLSQVEASQIGKQLKKASDLAGMPIIRIHDSKFGEVNGYHKDILAKVLGF
jgi:prophage antirepressor-like protein